MTYTYCTKAQVKAELRATTDFSATTYPTDTQVDDWIAQESDEVNAVSGRIWGSSSYTETIDYNGESVITLKNAPVITVTSLLYSTSPLGSTTYSLSDTKVEDTDYTVYDTEGEVEILYNWSPVPGKKRMQVNYTAGYTTVPERVQKLATKKVTKRVIDTLLSKDINEKQSGKSVSVGSISIVKPANFGVEQYKTLSQEIKELEQTIANGSTAYRIGGHRG